MIEIFIFLYFFRHYIFDETFYSVQQMQFDIQKYYANFKIFLRLYLS